ncbi:MAG: ROK family protein [Anaerolineales bacterium]|nr:ROK family protein [Anaerolineales bacterium]
MQRARLRTGDQTLVREINLALILDNIRELGPISRAGLAELTGLNKTTVSSIIQELIDGEFVHEVGLASSGIGRPAVLLEINPNAGVIISAEIGVDFISTIRTNFSPEVLWEQQEPIRPEMGQRAIILRTLALLHDAVESSGSSKGDIFGMAVGVPGLVDQTTNVLLFAPNLGWRDVPLARILRDDFHGVPIFVDNEANLAALGEYYFGVAQGCEDVLYISAGVGLGGGILRNGVIFRGKTGVAGEFGHMTMDPNGELCNCGNRGCWETQVSQRSVFHQIKSKINAGQESILPVMLEGDLEGLNIPTVIEAATEGDKVVLQVLDGVGHDLGVGIASLVNALNPDLVVFGGILSLAADFLLPTAKIELEKRALEWNRSATKILPARYGFDACIMGGVATVYQKVLAYPGGAAW